MKVIEMNKTLIFLLALGSILMVGCNSINQSNINNNEDSNGIKTLPDGTKYIIHPDKILSGGPSKDGIPSIDNPKFISANEADWLNDDDLVLGLVYKGIVKAYPHRILNWHEIVNDKVESEKVLITYCPLCRTGIAFKPIVYGEEIEFGTSGKLFNSELVMYDRKTESYWTQSLGLAIIGPASGEKLEKIPLDTVRWRDWKNIYPDTLVLSKKTGFFKNYDRIPYGNYESSEQLYFPVDNKDNRLHPKEIVFGVEFNGKSKAYAEKDVEDIKIINDIVGDVPVVVLWDNGLNTVKIFERTLGNEVLEFFIKGNKFMDNKDNEWTVNEMLNKLKVVDTFGHFWFAWAAFFPETELYE